MNNYDNYIGKIININKYGNGKIKYIGKIQDKIGIFVGIELINNDKINGINNGSVQGIKYFNTINDEYSGIFININKILPILEQEQKQNNNNNNDDNTINEYKRIIQQYQNKVKNQNEELMKCKEIIEEQRIVQEEIQLLMDDNEITINLLKEKLINEKSDRKIEKLNLLNKIDLLNKQLKNEKSLHNNNNIENSETLININNNNNNANDKPIWCALCDKEGHKSVDCPMDIIIDDDDDNL